MKRFLRPLLLLAATGLLGACETPIFSEAQTLGGQTISAEELNRGYELYMLNCYACHGEKGDGRGPAAPGLRPPPRNFTQALFKFTRTMDPEDDGHTLPSDAGLLRIIKRGLHGTPMLAWALTDQEFLPIIQYIKTFSDEWKTRHPGAELEISPDPFAGDKAAAGVAKGEQVYYKLARCWSCHPSYVTMERFHALTGQDPRNEVRDNHYRSELKASQHEVPLGDGSTYKVKSLPTDFLSQEVRSIHEIEDVYRILGTGIGGTAMPQWKGSLQEEDLWALTHYTYSLIQLRDTPAGATLKAKLNAQPKWEPPPPPPPPEPPAEPALGAEGGAAAPAPKNP